MNTEKSITGNSARRRLGLTLLMMLAILFLGSCGAKSNRVVPIDPGERSELTDKLLGVWTGFFSGPFVALGQVEFTASPLDYGRVRVYNSDDRSIVDWRFTAIAEKGSMGFQGSWEKLDGTVRGRFQGQLVGNQIIGSYIVTDEPTMFGSLTLHRKS